MNNVDNMLRMHQIEHTEISVEIEWNHDRTFYVWNILKFDIEPLKSILKFMKELNIFLFST